MKLLFLLRCRQVYKKKNVEKEEKKLENKKKIRKRLHVCGPVKEEEQAWYP